MGEIDQTSVLVALIGFAGVFITQVVVYIKQKNERISGTAEAQMARASERQQLLDRLDTIDKKLDAHSNKLDKHNGFEGRIINLETIAEYSHQEHENNRELIKALIKQVN